MLWIISGPSSVGKSTFLGSDRCREITGLDPEAPALFAFEPGLAERELDNTLFHYNLLRPAASFHRRQAAAAATWAGRIRRFFCGRSSPEDEISAFRSASKAFQQDPAWMGIINHPVQKKAIVLLANRERILERVQQRREIERTMPAATSNSYKAQEWLRLYEKIDLTDLYRAWCSELRSAGIEYLTVDSNDLQFRLCPAP